MEKTIFSAVQAVFAAYALTVLIPQLCFPGRYLTLSKRWGDVDRATGAERWVIWLRFLPFCIGTFVILYHAAFGLLGWMPLSWGSHDEDGQWTSARPYIQAMIALVGSFGLIGAGGHKAELAARAPTDRSVLDAILNEIERPSFGDATADSLKNRVLIAAERAATSALRHDGEAVQDYREDLARWINRLKPRAQANSK